VRVISRSALISYLCFYVSVWAISAVVIGVADIRFVEKDHSPLQGMRSCLPLRMENTGPKVRLPSTTVYMWCYITPWCVCDVILHHSVYVMLYYTVVRMWCYTTPWCVCDVILHHGAYVMLYYTMVRMWCYITPWCVCDVILHHGAYVMLYYTMVRMWYYTMVCMWCYILWRHTFGTLLSNRPGIELDRRLLFAQGIVSRALVLSGW